MIIQEIHIHVRTLELGCSWEGFLNEVELQSAIDS